MLLLGRVEVPARFVDAGEMDVVHRDARVAAAERFLEDLEAGTHLRLGLLEPRLGPQQVAEVAAVAADPGRPGPKGLDPAVERLAVLRLRSTVVAGLLLDHAEYVERHGGRARLRVVPCGEAEGSGAQSPALGVVRHSMTDGVGQRDRGVHRELPLLVRQRSLQGALEHAPGFVQIIEEHQRGAASNVELDVQRRVVDRFDGGRDLGEAFARLEVVTGAQRGVGGGDLGAGRLDRGDQLRILGQRHHRGEALDVLAVLEREQLVDDLVRVSDRRHVGIGQGRRDGVEARSRLAQAGHAQVHHAVGLLAADGGGLAGLAVLLRPLGGISGQLGLDARPRLLGKVHAGVGERIGDRCRPRIAPHLRELVLGPRAQRSIVGDREGGDGTGQRRTTGDEQRKAPAGIPEA